MLATNIAVASPGEKQAEIAYAEALAARGAGRPDIAESILRNLLSENPNAAQVRFDLGVALAEQKRCAAASRTFDAGARQTNTPDYQRAVQAAMEDLCPGLAPFEFSLGFNLVLDSNANGGAGDSSISIGGIPIALSSEAVAQSVSGYQATAEIAYNHKIGATSYIVPSLGIAVSDYEGGSLDSYAINTGLSFRYQGDRIDWRVGPTAIFGFDAEGLATTGGGISGRGSMALGPRTGLHFGASHIKISDQRNDLRDYAQSALNGTIVHRLENAPTAIRIGLEFTDRDYRDDFQDIRSFQMVLGVSGALSKQIGYDLSYNHRSSRGSVPHFLFGDRRDKVDTLSASVSFSNLEGWYGRPYVGISHSISNSTWESKTYDRTRVLVGFTRRF